MATESEADREPSDAGTPALVGAALRIPIQLAVVCGGVAALSWEVLWQLEAALALGISALGTAVTLATTMLGIAVGSLLAGRALRGRSIANPMRVYGMLELVIGVAGLAMLPGFALLEQLDVWLYRLNPAAAPAAHLLGIAVLLGPATLAMGATVPVFQLISRATTLRVSVLYGLNTAGACAGVLAVSFALLPTLGVTLTACAIAAVNLGVATSMWLMPPPDEAVTAVEEGTERAPARGVHVGFGLAMAVVCVTGLATFGLEVAWFRALRSAFWSTTATFAIILASVLGPLALSARLVPWLRSRGISLGWVVSAAGIAILLATPLVERMDLYSAGMGGYVIAKWLALSLAILGPPMLLLGVALPWCLESYPNPRDSARLYALNALSSVLGSLLAAWWWLPAMGFARTAWLLALCVLGVGVAMCRPRMRVGVGGVGVAAILIAASLSSSAGRDRPYRKEGFETSKLIAIDEGPDSTATVIERENGERALLIDGFTATSEARRSFYKEWMGRLPMLLHADPGEALVICFGTGRTAWAALDEGPSHLDVVDVSAAVLRMAPLFPSNHGVLDDPKVLPTLMDGRAWLRRSPKRYDVVTLEPMPPNFAGVTALYSREFYQIVASRLEPGGIVAQWLPFHLVSPAHAVAITATFIETFPDSVMWIAEYGTGILVGRRPRPSQQVALGKQWPGFERRQTDRPLERRQIISRVMMGPELLERYAAGATIVTDDNQLLSFSEVYAGSLVNSDREYGPRNLKIVRKVIDEYGPRRPRRARAKVQAQPP